MRKKWDRRTGYTANGSIKIRAAVSDQPDPRVCYIRLTDIDIAELTGKVESRRRWAFCVRRSSLLR